MLGYRIGFIRKQDQAKFDRVHTLADLRRFSFGLGQGWERDIQIYRQAGITLRIDPYEKLFTMLAAGRFDYFSRGINEIYEEYRAFNLNNNDIAIEKHILLHYPYPFYFFVSPSAPTLAKRIEAGLQIMLKDGSFDALFWKYNRDNIQRADLANRRVIELESPSLPPLTPISNKKLWYNPQEHGG